LPGLAPVPSEQNVGSRRDEIIKQGRNRSPSPSGSVWQSLWVGGGHPDGV